jgi:hypothetical protein
MRCLIGTSKCVELKRSTGLLSPAWKHSFLKMDVNIHENDFQLAGCPPQCFTGVKKYRLDAPDEVGRRCASDFAAHRGASVRAG